MADERIIDKFIVALIIFISGCFLPCLVINWLFKVV
jgi:hypothetical protein